MTLADNGDTRFLLRAWSEMISRASADMPGERASGTFDRVMSFGVSNAHQLDIDGRL